MLVKMTWKCAIKFIYYSEVIEVFSASVDPFTASVALEMGMKSGGWCLNPGWFVGNWFHPWNCLELDKVGSFWKRWIESYMGTPIVSFLQESFSNMTFLFNSHGRRQLLMSFYMKVSFRSHGEGKRGWWRCQVVWIKPAKKGHRSWYGGNLFRCLS